MPGRPTSDDALRILLAGWSPAGSRIWLQAAAAGRWEDASGVDLPAADAVVRSLVRQAGPDDVAVEYEWLGRPLVFVGARRGAGEAASFEDAVARVAQARPADPGAALAGLAGGTPSGLDLVELGAVNAWRSVGPLCLGRGDQGRAEGTVEHLLAARPELMRCRVPVALEVAFSRPRACWLGIEVSRPSGDRHVVETCVVQAMLDQLF